MRKLFSICGKAASKVALALTMLLSAGAAYAADPTPISEVNQVLQAGVTYSYTQYQSVSAQYTPAVSGTLRLEGFQGVGIYKECITPGAQYDAEITAEVYTTVDPGGRIRTFPVNAGETVYFYDSFIMDAGTVTLYMEGVNQAPLKLQYMDPAENTVVDFNNYPALSATFDSNIKVADPNAVISFKNRTTDATEELLSRATAGGKLLTVSFYSLLKPYIASGAIQPGDPFTVTVKGLTSAEGEPYENAEANGDVVFHFLCGSIPVVANQTYVPNPFLSYWPKGTPEGILKIAFDKNLGTSPKTYCTLKWGNQEGEAGEYYTEDLPVIIDGNVALVDFTGVLRTPATMTPLYPNASYNVMGIDLTGLVDEYGVPVGSDGSGTVGSYSYGPAYKIVERTSIAAEFEPANGTDLNLASNVNVWISGIDANSFDGFNIEYTDKATGATATVVVPLSDVKITPDGTDAAEYDFAMPKDVIDNASKAVITLSNLATNDGYDHSNDIRVTYGGFVVTYADPANGTEMAMLKEGTTIVIESNLAEKYPNMYVEYEIINLNPEPGEDAIIKSASWMFRQENGSYQSEVYGNYKMMYGKEYKVKFTAWEDESVRWPAGEPLGEDFIIWKGLTPPYIYSTISLTGISPENESTLEADVTAITVTFDGIVNLGTNGVDTGIVYGMGAGLSSFSKIEALDPQEIDGTTYSSSWKLEFPTDYVANTTTPILITLKAFDESGRYVKGDLGEETDTYFQFTYFPAGMFRDIEVSFGEEPVTSVSKITVGFPLGINYGWEIPMSEVKVYDKAYNVVAEMVDYEMIDNPNSTDERWLTSVEGRIILNKPVTKEGDYILVIPRSFFELGSEFTTYKSAEVNQLFSIAAGPYSVDPEAGEVESLYEITVKYNTVDDVTLNDKGLEATWNKGDEPVVFTNPKVFGNFLTLSFGDEISEPGEYTVYVPAGYVIYADGTESPEVLVTYTIAEEVIPGDLNVTADPAEGQVTAIPSVIALFFNDYESANPGEGVATLTVNDGTPIDLPASEWDMDDWDNVNKLLQPMGQEYTAEGTYVISFPAGYFSLGDMATASPEFTLTYTIGEDSAVEAVDMLSNEYTVYTLTGVCVLNRADRDAFKALAPGLYIVNGVKMVVK